MLGLKFEKESSPWWVRSAIPFFAIAVTFVFTALFLFIARVDPLAAFYAMLIEPLTASVSALEVFVKMTPLLLTGVAVVFAFRSGYYNIGAEGQLYAGALVAAWVGQLPMANTTSPVIMIPMMILGGMLGGTLWALAPALLRTRLEVDEVVTTLLLNTVMLYIVSAVLNGPWLDPVTHWPQSPRISPNAEFPIIIAGSRVHFGLIVGLVIMIGMWFVVRRTPLGLRLRAVGLNKDAARFMGINVGRHILIAALVSGAIAGVAGASEVAGIHHRLLEDISANYGYSGIVIATLGELNPFGAGLAAFFIALVQVGGQSVSRKLGIPTFLADIVQATLLLTMLAMLLLTQYRLRFTRRQKTAVTTTAPPPSA